MPDIEAFQRALGYDFRIPGLAREALTHSSLVNELAGTERQANTRQEFLGDAVVELAIRAALVDRFQQAQPGQLDPVKQRIVRNDNIAAATRPLGLARFLELGASRPAESDHVVAQVFEAAVGAVFLDAGFEAARRVVERHLPIPIKLSES